MCTSGFAGIRRTVRLRPGGSIQAIGTSDFWVNHSNRPLHNRAQRPGAEGVPRRPGIHLRSIVTALGYDPRESDGMSGMHDVRPDRPRPEAGFDACLADQLVRPDAAADRTAPFGRLARLSDGADGAGQRGGFYHGALTGTVCHPLAQNTVSRADRQRFAPVERDSCGQAIDAHDGWTFHRRLDCDRNAALRRLGQPLRPTGPRRRQLVSDRWEPPTTGSSSTRVAMV